MTNYTERVKALRHCADGSSIRDCADCEYELYDDCTERLIKDAAAEIEELQAKISELGESYSANLVAAQNAQPHWVSVEDELPEPNIQCLVRDDDCNYAVGYYRQDVKAWDSPFFGWVERDDEYYEDGDLCRIGKVVAWMPLPEPPQEVQDGSKG